MEHHTILLVVFCVFGFNIYAVMTLDPKLAQCKDKLMKQATLVKFDKLPDCFNPESLATIKNSTDTFGQLFFEHLPEKCKKPDLNNVKECVKSINGILQSHSDDFKSVIFDAINAMFYVSKDCVKDLSDRLSNLDKYLQSGCSD